jgi:TolA-binding protein
VAVTEASVLRLPDPESAGAERRVFLLSGELVAQVAPRPPSHPFVVVTPQLRVVVVGTRFRVVVGEGITRVSVQEGRVRLESAAGKELLLERGDAARSDEEPRFLPTPAQVAPPAELLALDSRPPAAGVGECALEQAVPTRRACYEKVAGGEGLAAQNAVYALALLARDEEHHGARAIRHFREYERRFEQGLLAPEVAVSLMRELLQQQRFAEALQAADRLRRRFPSDPRAAEAALVHANLLCTHFGQLEPAMKDYEEALGPPARPSVREEALFSRATCEQTLGRAEEARRTLRLYLELYPAGSHAAEVARRLAK